MRALYLSVLLMNVADSLLSIFVPIFLYQLGYAIPRILFFYWLGHLGSVVGAISISNAVRRVGPKSAMLMATPFLIAYYLGLRVLPENPALFWLLPFLLAARTLLYNFGFDWQYFQNMTKEKSGRQYSWMSILTIAGGVVAPVLAALIIRFYGFGLLFASGAVLLIGSALPLFFVGNGLSPSRPERLSVVAVGKLISDRAWRRPLASFAGYAIDFSIALVVWPLFLFFILGSTEQVGYVVAVSAFVTALVIALVGKLTDQYRLRPLLRVVTALHVVGWIASALVRLPVAVWVVNTYRRLTEWLVLVPWGAAFFRYLSPENYWLSIIARDLVFNGARVIILPLFMAIFTFFDYPFQVSFVVAALFASLYPLFASSAITANAPASCKK